MEPSRPLCSLRPPRSAPTLVLRTLALGLIVAVAGTAPARAQGFVYTLSDEGRLWINALFVEDLPGNSNEVGQNGGDFDKVWAEFAIDGTDRHIVRHDGRLYANGAKVKDLNDGSGAWRAVTVLDGSVYVLRSTGRLVRDQVHEHSFNDGDHSFVDMATDGVDIFALRSDGRVFRGWEQTNPPILRYRGSPDSTGEGDSTKKTWRKLRFDPVTGDLYAMRNDGRIAAADPDLVPDGETQEATVVAILPFGDEATSEKRYWDFEFFDDGVWLAVRGNGQVYRADDLVTPLVDLPGDSDESSKIYRNLLTVGTSTEGSFFTLRRDGSLFRDTGEEALIDFPEKGYRQLGFSLEQPDLGAAYNRRPVLTRYVTTVVTGDMLVQPVIATDVETASADLVVTVDETTLPPGAVWDDVARTITWRAVGPKGKYKVKVTVEDGQTKIVKSKITIKVVEPDTNLTKNLKPVVAKINKAVGLQGLPIVLPIFASDRDGDELTLTVDETKYPYTAGASFDTETNTFLWDSPVADDLGKVKLTFQVTDGTVTVKRKVTLDIKASLLSF